MPQRTKSQTSMGSIGFGPETRPQPADGAARPITIELSSSKLEPEGGSAPPGEYMYNCIAVVIYCKDHKKVVLSFNERSEATWLPFFTAPHNKTWSDATNDGIQMMFSKEAGEIDARLANNVPIKNIHCVHIMRIQLPISKKFVYRLVQVVQLGENTIQFTCCQDSKRLRWVPHENAVSGTIDKLWGPEVAIFCAYLPQLQQQEIYEYGLDQAYHWLPKGNSGTLKPEEEMLRVNGIGISEVEPIYSDFLEHCFPAFYMTYPSFLRYLADLCPDWKLRDNEVQAVKLFHTFNCSGNGYLSFHEFLLGLAATEPKTPTNVARLNRLFRHYDLNQDEELSQEEVANMIAELKVDAKKVMAHIAKLSNNKPVTLSVFIKLVESAKLPVDKVCRSPCPVFPKICKNFADRNKKRATAKKPDTKAQKPENRGRCLGCRDKQYEFGSHCVRLDPTGRCVEPHLLPDSCEGAEEEEKTGEISMFKYSQDYVFSTMSIGNTFLDMIRDFGVSKGTSRAPLGFLSQKEYRDIFMQYLNILCLNVRGLLDCENKLMKINSPAYVIGDLRGSLDDLLLMERSLWQEIPVVANNFVFLGNYCNSGKWGIECVLYVFALKVVAPNKFFLIRGASETRSAQKGSPTGLQTECINKYGDKHGQIVWGQINDVFDRMCLSVIIDESVMCVSGGLPDRSSKIEDIANLDADIKDPYSEAIANELLTNNKCSDEHISEYLQRNKLTHVLRSNQPIKEGFQISSNGKSITICSNSAAGGKKSQPAVLCVDHPKIRIVLLESGKGDSSSE